MSWEAIGFLAELPGATAVVVSLIDLALQVRFGGPRAEWTPLRILMAEKKAWPQLH